MSYDDISFYFGGEPSDGVEDMIEEEEVGMLYDNLDVYVHDSPLLSSLTNDDETLFTANALELIQSNAAILNLSDQSEKSHVELGQAWGINYMLGVITELAQNSLKIGRTGDDAFAILGSSVIDLLETVPLKKIYCYKTNDNKELSGHTKGLVESGADLMSYADIIEDSKQVIEEIKRLRGNEEDYDEDDHDE